MAEEKTYWVGDPAQFIGLESVWHIVDLDIPKLRETYGADGHLEYCHVPGAPPPQVIRGPDISHILHEQGSDEEFLVVPGFPTVRTSDGSVID